MKRLVIVFLLCTAAAFAQQNRGTLKGRVSDEFGGVIVGATIIATDGNGTTKTGTTDRNGTFTLSGLVAGKYTVRVSAQGFATFESLPLEIPAGATQVLEVTMSVTIEQQKVTVSADTNGVNTEPENNVGALVLRGVDLQSLPDDPDDLLAALQALAGPAAGPNGGQIYIDGFTGGRLPPLSSIREIRINSNPYSAEYDRPGFGRIEIFTKPGTDRFRGQANFSYNNQAFNSRNPFATTRAPYMSRNYGGNLSGPISKKKASFFFDFDKRDINDEAIVSARILDQNLNIVPFSESVLQPNRRFDFSPRVDYQINSTNTLVLRYEYEHAHNTTGAGGFSLGSRKYETFNTQQTIRLTETSIINKRTVNETRFQFNSVKSGDTADNSIPTVSVQDAFTGGGSQIGLTSNKTNRWEFANNTSLAAGLHSVRFGARARGVVITSVSPQNFGGSWTFTGSGRPGDATALTSIQAYQITEQGLQQGKSGAEIRAAGGGATQFSINAGNPRASVSQFDVGLFAQDDWRLRPNLTVNLGLRYENQNNISSNLNLAPRVGFAWAPRSTPQKPSKMTIRGGFGFFYDRIAENLTLTANRLNGTNQQQYIVTDRTILDLFPVVPTIAALQAFAQPVTIYQLAKDIQAPYTMQTAISLERALPHSFTTSITFSHARTLHVLRTRAINAPSPGTFNPLIPGSGTRPLGVNDYFEYDSTGRFNQNQLIVTLGSRLSRSVSFNANYIFSKSNSDSDGTGTFAANPFDFSTEYGRASNDIRHRFTLVGNFRAPWNISLSPFFILSSGSPFNITIGRDLNGDKMFTERPAFATDLTKPGIIFTRFGVFDPNPVAGETIIPRNFGTGPGSLIANLRVSKSFAFGGERRTAAQNNGPNPGAMGGGPPRGGPGGIAMGGPGGGMGPPPGGGGGGFGGPAFGGGEGQRYNLTVSVNFQNILNHVNWGRPVGNLSSSLFGTSNSSAGGFGGFGGGGRGGGSSPYNRLIEMQLRFSF